MEVKLMTLADVMQFFKISRRTAYYWIRNKILKPVKIAGTLRFRSTDIYKLIEESPSRNTTPKILAIDDDILVRNSLQQFLTRFGYTVTTVSSGYEAVALLKKENFDLVISDFRMPDMDGIETLTKIKAIRSSMPQILLTAYRDNEIEEKAQKLGVRNVISKPFDLEDFSKTIEITLN